MFYVSILKHFHYMIFFPCLSSWNYMINMISIKASATEATSEILWCVCHSLLVAEYNKLIIVSINNNCIRSYLQFGILSHNGVNVTLTERATISLYFTFSSPAMIVKWQQCCIDAIKCCLNYHQKYPLMRQTASTDSQYVGMCPPTWDGWLCWNEYAKPNQVLERPCPKHIYWHQIVPPCRGKSCLDYLLFFFVCKANFLRFSVDMFSNKKD